VQRSVSQACICAWLDWLSSSDHLQLMGSQSQKLLTACSFLISDFFCSTTRRTFFVLATASAFYRARATRSVRWVPPEGGHDMRHKSCGLCVGCEWVAIPSAPTVLGEGRC
jgi:hypothetical protein